MSDSELEWRCRPDHTSVSSSPLLPPPSTTTTTWEQGVFLCFRGADTREGFTGYLFQALVGAGIDTFMDDRLPKGTGISELLDRIEKSRISVVIFSENFASSRWCLDELVKILECKERMGQEVLPIFYKVHPSQLRDLSKGGKTAEYLASHAENCTDNSEKIEKWRLAIKYFADLKGWHFTQGVESKLVSEIVELVENKLDLITDVGPPDGVSLEVDDPTGIQVARKITETAAIFIGRVLRFIYVIVFLAFFVGIMGMLLPQALSELHEWYFPSSPSSSYSFHVIPEADWNPSSNYPFAKGDRAISRALHAGLGVIVYFLVC